MNQQAQEALETSPFSAPTGVGVVYVATGQKYLRLALESLKYLRRVEPEVAVLLICDEGGLALAESAQLTLGFEIEVMQSPDYSFTDKVRGILAAKFEKIIYLDTDVFPVAPFCDDLIRALEFFPLVALPGMSLNHDWEAKYSVAVSQYNTGVLALDRGRSEDFLSQWLTHYSNEERPGHDQPSFRAAIIESGIRCGPLGSEFNFMGTGSIQGGARLVHVTAWRRLQPFFQSGKNRSRMMERFGETSLSGFFVDFSEAGSHNGVRGKGIEGRLSWWIKGSLLWFWFRIRRFTLGGLRRLRIIDRGL